jgi:hypothetical protein
MSAIYLRHPIHGTKVACAEQEASYDEKNGWVRFDPSVPVEPEAVEPEAVEPVPITETVDNFFNEINSLEKKKKGNKLA